jgi:predicted nucleotidyltransferase
VQDKNNLYQMYQAALDAFLEKVKTDNTIIAVYLYGSLARGNLWEKSDIDVFLVTKDERDPFQAFSLVENGINFHAEVYARSHFRRAHERLLRGSALHSLFSSGKLVYALDESLHDYYQDTGHVGARDRELLTLLYGAAAVCGLSQIEKALRVKQDVAHGFMQVMRTVEDLARVEVSLNGKIMEREVISQALDCNPAFFDAVFTDLIPRGNDAQALQAALDTMDAYLAERATVVFKPLLAYLAHTGQATGASELYRRFENRLRIEPGDHCLTEACEWLVEKGIIQRVCAPVKLTTKSRVQMDQVAYYYAGGETR